MVKCSNFPGCCGGHVLHNFGYTDITEGDDENFDLDLVETEIVDYINMTKRRAFLAITLNDEQVEVYDDMMKKLGFQCVGNGHNTPHKSEVYVYIRFNKRG